MLFLGCGFLLTGNCLSLPFARPRIRPCTLASDRQSLTVAKTAVGVDIHQPLDVHLHFAAERTFDFEVGGDNRTDLCHLFIIEVTDALAGIDTRLLQNLSGAGSANPKNVCQANFGSLVLW